MKKEKFSDFIKFIAFVFCFVCIPLVMVFVGYFYTGEQNRRLFENKLSHEISAFYTKLEPFSEPQMFWYYLFKNSILKKAKKGKTDFETVSNISNILKELQKGYDFDYIVFHPNYGAIADIDSDTLNCSLDDLKKAINTIYTFKLTKSYEISYEEQNRLGKIFGPQIFIEHLNSSEYDIEGFNLCWTDSLYKKSLIWNTSVYGCLVMTFLKPKYLEDSKYIKQYLYDSSKELEYEFGFSIKDTENNSFLHPNIKKEQIDEIEKASFIYENDHLLEINTDNYYVYPKFLRPGVTIYGYFNKTKINDSQYLYYWKVGIFFVFLFGIFLSFYGWKVIVLHKLDRVSIKWKLGFLFFFANGLPLLVLIFIGNDFLKQAHADYIQKKIDEGTLFLQNFDEKYELEFARSIIRKEKIKKNIVSKRQNSVLIGEDIDCLYNGISSNTWSLFIIASQGQTLVRNYDGVFDDKDLKKSSKGNYKGSNKYQNMDSEKFDKHLSSQIEFSQKLGYYLLNRFNNKPIDTKRAAEVELILESTLRRNLDSFIFDLINKLGNFMSLGFGKNVYPALIDTISMNEKDGYDYFVLATIRTRDFLNDYLNKVMPQANKNEIGLNVIVWNNEKGYFPNNQKSGALDEFRKRLSPYPVNEPIIIKHNKNDYIAMGFECKHIERSYLIGLYPLDLIDEHVKLRRNELILFSFVSIIITIMLSSLIIRGFLTPLSAIYTGAKAIEQKNFEHRLPNLGRDEFGAMGKIFNEVIVDLEELSVAGAIQEQLLPNSEIKTGYFSLYGKSVAMGALGGDYFDFIEMEDNKFSVALGDVAGHGVGASLIMAMAKAGLISLDYLWKSPQKLIAKLHEMVYKSKTQNQKKIMTFQYMYLDGNAGEAIYSNAGGCSPIIVRKSAGIVEELKLPGAVLGAFKKGKFAETTVKFDVGDAIVFYSDGIVECKDKKGIVLGYDNLKILLQRCWNEKAEQYYDNIYRSYLEYIGGNKSDAEDDVTIVVIVFNKPSVA